MTIHFNTIKTKSIIATLRERYPGKWTFKLYLMTWYHKDGRYVRACSALAPRYDGDDDSFVTEYWMYGPNMTPKQVYF